MVIGAILAAVLATSSGAEDPIEEARSLIRRGLLGRAESLLQQTEAGGAPMQRAWAALLQGNIAFERGDLDLAAVSYARAAEAFSADPSEAAAAGRSVAAGNLEMVRERQARRAELRGRMSRIAVLIAAFVLLAAAGVVILARRTSERAWSPEAPRPS